MPTSRKRTDRVAAAVLAALAAFGAAQAAAAGEPAILAREAWHANAPVLAMTPHTPRQITVHHSAVAANRKHPLASKLRSLQAFSQSPAKLASGGSKPAWADVPYHFYIDVTGEIGEGRAIGFAGDTNTGYDPRGHIGVVLEGNFETAEPTLRQIASLEQLLEALARRWNIPAERIRGHKDVARTLCPGQALAAALPGVRERVARRLK